MRFETVLLENSDIQLIDGDRGKNYPKQADFSEDGFCLFLSAKNVTSSGFEFSERSYISSEKDELLRAGKLQRGDIVVTTRGTIGNVAYYGDDVPFDHIRINSGMMIFRADENRWNKRFLYFLLTSSFIRQQIDSLTSGSAVPQLPARDLKKFSLPNIPKIIQDRIERVVGDLSDKIKFNRQTNQTLEQIAQAIFKSWFVDFDPVKAKIEALTAGGSTDDAELAAMSVISAKTLDELNGLKASNPEAFNKLAQTAALFPAAMQDSELGEIPEGWEVSDLASCTTELRRGISPKYIEEGGVLVINQKCIRNHTIDFSLARRNDSSKRKVDGREIVIGDVLVNSTGVGTLGRLAPIRFLNETTVADSHVTVVRANTTKISKSFLAGLMLTNEAYIEASGAGSTGQTELRKQVLEDIKFVKPLSAVDRLFDEIASNFNAQIAELEKQRVTLSLTRDALLPKLLSGELVGE